MSFGARDKIVEDEIFLFPINSILSLANNGT